ncbi:MAG: SIS domain-containing protein, partial [Thermoplasmata archaeon]
MNFNDYSQNYLNTISKLISSVPMKDLETAVGILKTAYLNNKKIILMGNGGSASTASHLTCDLSKSTIKPNKPRLKVFCLSDNIPLITAWSNDTHYDNIFSEQLLNIIEKGDVVIAFSGSGNSRNILKAIEVANKAGGITIGLCGFKGGKLASIAQHSIIVNSDNMQQICCILSELTIMLC